MAEYWSGLLWCDKCQQMVDVYSNEKGKFRCGFCGKLLHQEAKSKKKLKKVL